MSSDWYRDAIIYEVHVRGFRDDNGDGIGDFKGLTSKLDYIRDLGVTAIWLLPFYPSPLRDDGYDIGDYKSIHPAYGTMADFRRFLREAHRRDLKVITELVINHTSDQHPWFQKARHAEQGDPARDFYVWSDDPGKYGDARIIFQDTETSNWAWDPVAGAYYWHRFFSHQPDLNFENPSVHEAVFDVLDFWLDMGVDGLRLDAVPYLYEREGTMCENLPETHEFLKSLRARVDSKYDDRMLLAEANQWPEDAVAYFGDGDECHMNFHFPLMPRLFMGLRQENRFPIIDILEQTPDIPDSTAWAFFLRNHDELTLEMVTDEERDYMYRVYAEDPQARINVGIRRRLAPLLRNNRREIELLHGLLLSLPGTPVLYYGDEIGMGDNVYLGDRNGVRTPMQWSGDRSAGFSEANPQRLYFPVVTDPEYHYEAVNVALQRANPNSLWWWMKRVLSTRKSLPELSRGAMEFVPSDNAKVLTFLRRGEDRSVLVVANLSRHPQPVAMDLADHIGLEPLEVMGRTRFPAIGEDPYRLTIGAHELYWLVLEHTKAEGPEARPRINLSSSDPGAVFRARVQLQRALMTDVTHRRWFRSKARTVTEAEIIDILEMPGTDKRLGFVRFSFTEAEPETYVVGLGLTTGEEAEEMLQDPVDGVIAEVSGMGTTAVLHHVLEDEEMSRSLLSLTDGRRRVKGPHVALQSGGLEGSSALSRGVSDESFRASPSDQSNTSVVFGESVIMKVYRKVEAGPNPEVETSRFLTEVAGFPHTPRPVGLVKAVIDGQSAILALAQEFVASQGNALEHTLNSAVLTLETILADLDDLGLPPRLSHPLDMTSSDLDVGRPLMGASIVEAALLGRRTAEMHLALASAPAHPVFGPQPLTTLQQRSIYQGIRSSLRTSLAMLKRRRASLSESDRELAAEVIESESILLDCVKRITGERFDADLIRIHGDYHLGQVLFTGNDFSIIDFEGEPQRPVSQRRIKRLALRDVAGMLRSYDYTVVMALDMVSDGQPEPTKDLEGWARAMRGWMSSAFLTSYLETVGETRVVPSDREQLRALLDALVIEKASYELDYELNNRPDWVSIPLRGLMNAVS